jgi:hypothetical protein
MIRFLLSRHIITYLIIVGVAALVTAIFGSLLAPIRTADELLVPMATFVPCLVASGLASCLGTRLPGWEAMTCRKLGGVIAGLTSCLTLCGAVALGISSAIIKLEGDYTWPVTIRNTFLLVGLGLIGVAIGIAWLGWLFPLAVTLCGHAMISPTNPFNLILQPDSKVGAFLAATIVMILGISAYSIRFRSICRAAHLHGEAAE